PSKNTYATKSSRDHSGSTGDALNQGTHKTCHACSINANQCGQRSKRRTFEPLRLPYLDTSAKRRFDQ
ncbi:hypothetical protein, partial [Microbispora amethystogenes]|uniref:hypothetical protein n=1 Tax=Microbispora amethystogenes TaxID=1427754 RepID=UPI00195381D7